MIERRVAAASGNGCGGNEWIGFPLLNTQSIGSRVAAGKVDCDPNFTN
jgi:hypothetical protein